MQPASTSRSSKRTTTDSSNPSQPSTAPGGNRTSSGSSKSSSHRRQNPGQQLSQIEKSVTHLLVATKQLLETLTQWSRHHATEGEVSDVYVRLGYEFNIACRAFNGIGVDTSDLGPVPELLRSILEETLSQEASPASLDRFLPRIRDIIINLLHGLKRKQQKLRAKQAKDGQANGASLPTASSSGNVNMGLNQILEDASSRKSAERISSRRTGSGSTLTSDYLNGDQYQNPETLSKYQVSGSTFENVSNAQPDLSTRQSSRDSHQPFPSSFSESTISSNASQPTPTTSVTLEDGYQNSQATARPVSQREKTPFFQPPPPPPPKQQDALAALQRGGDLERRASRRYSAYQISKHLGASTNGMPMLPPAQNSPVPNRGRDVRDSMNAVRTRGSGVFSKGKSTASTSESSPVRNNVLSNRISEESSQSESSRHEVSITAPEDGDQGSEASKIKPTASPRPQLRATLTSPIEFVPTYSSPTLHDDESTAPAQQASAVAQDLPSESVSVTPQYVAEESPQPGKELTLFLQYKTRIKKFILPGGSNDLSVARLQLAFIEKFAWNTHSNGNDLPEIYIQDPTSGVRHELEDLRDVKDRSVLVLNIEPLDEVKKHIDEGLGGLRKLVEGVRNAVDGQQLSLQQVSDRQHDTSKDLARLSIRAPPTSIGTASDSKPKSNLPANHASTIKALRQELAIARQTITSLVSDVNNSMAHVREKAASIKTMAIEGVIPDLDSTTGRSYVNEGKKSLGEESEAVVNQVDDLQDVVEELRKDVVSRGVRPLPRQLENVNKSISQASAEVKKIQQFLRKEKPIWTKIWEKELEVVCTDRDFLTMQEELATDLEDDLEKATQTFALVEQATKQQNIQTSQGTGVTLRSTSKGLAAIASAADDIDPMKAKDGVLGEVRALRPNHETRLEAIERAEKARQKELASRKEGEFTKEVTAFVEEGRLKKSGGVEEMDRLRKARDEQNMRQAWQTQQDRAMARANEETEGAEGPQTPEAESETFDGQLDNQFSEERGAEHEETMPSGSMDIRDESTKAPGSPSSPSKRSSWLPAIFAS